MLVNPNNPEVTQSGSEVNILVQGIQRKDDTVGSYVIPASTQANQNLHLRANTNVFAICDNLVSYNSMTVHPSYDGQRIELFSASAITGKVYFAKSRGGVSAAQDLAANSKLVAQFSDAKGWCLSQVALTVLPN